jgi:hypothetical protein
VALKKQPASAPPSGKALQKLIGKSYLTMTKSACGWSNKSILDAHPLDTEIPEIGKASMEEGTREYVVAALPTYIVVYRIVQPEAVQIVRT